MGEASCILLNSFLLVLVALLPSSSLLHGRSKACPMVSLWEVSTDAGFVDHFKPRVEISNLPKVKGNG
ncbi:hypothetical protein L3X38_041511 [Prunus dulcis]|uniref:Uncharacterized protein n=1 Tax=Prunus dulcis TaxID=3755 RepID=A0AAD4YKZ7_PRUDU|nr:hypothetical protein L3X38_041511 [Prunus dulcis]